MSELESKFDEVIAKINVKLKEAAAALRAANELSYEANLPGLIHTQFTDNSNFVDSLNLKEDTEEYVEAIENLPAIMEKIDVSELEGELESAGWSTSSSYC